MVEKPDLSVVVCTFNGALKLGVCLNALTNQTIRDRIEIIVVDDGSLDATAQVVRGYDVTLIRHPVNRGLSAARNTGIAASTSDLIAFTDDDCIPGPKWAEQLFEAWGRVGDDVSAVGGLVTSAATDSFNRRYLTYRNPLAPTPLGLDPSTGLITRVRKYVAQANQVRSGDPSGPVASLVGANMSFRRSALGEIGGFDERRTFGGDESYVCERLREKCGESTVWCDTSLYLEHDFNAGFADTLRRAFAYGQGLGRNFATDGGIPSVQPAGALTVLTLAMLFFWPVVFVASILIVPAVLYRHSLVEAGKFRRWEMVSYPWVALMQEWWTNAGFAVGFSRAKLNSRD